MTANRRATHGGLVCRLAGVSVSSRDARWKDHQEHLAVYRRPSPDGINYRQVPDRRKKAPQPASGRLSRRKLLARSYFPFFGPFFSSFFAFFFIRISSSRSAHDRRHRQPFVLDLIYERSRQESRQYCRKMKNRLSRCGPGVITLAGQDGKPFAPYTDLDGMVFRAAVRSAGRVG